MFFPREIINCFFFYQATIEEDKAMNNHDDEICEVARIEGFPIPAANRPKLSGFEFYEKVLGSPKYVVSLKIYHF